MERYNIAGDHLRASIRTHGAELCQLQTGSGQDLLWDGDPAVWSGQAPTLFPVVGALKDNAYTHLGQVYAMAKHGFARDQEWSLVRLSGHACTLRLRDTAETRACFPFPFDLSLTFRIDGPSLRVQYDLRNPGEDHLLASLGAHPAFRWPLLPGIPKEAHWVEFEKPEQEVIAAMDTGGLITPQRRANPMEGRFLRLKDGLFAQDALIFQALQSRAVRYSAPGAPVLEVRWEGFPHLALWMKPGANFLCIEPWRGFASPSDFEGEFADKPGIFKVGPGATLSMAYIIRVLAPAV